MTKSRVAILLICTLVLPMLIVGCGTRRGSRIRYHSTRRTTSTTRATPSPVPSVSPAADPTAW